MTRLPRFAFVALIVSIALTCIAIPTASSYDAEALGRWKLDGSGGCYWDENDDGADQCDPNSPDGRYKLDGNGGCYWDPNDFGDDQCTPGEGGGQQTGCTPPLTEHPLDRHYNYVLHPLMTPYEPQVRAAITDVNDAIRATNNPHRLRLNSSTGTRITIEFRSFPAHKQGEVFWGENVIGISEAVLGYAGGLERTLRHELLHMAGLGHVNSPSSLMHSPFDPIANAGFPTTVTPMDKCGLTNIYGTASPGGGGEEDEGGCGEAGDPTVGSPAPCTPIVFHFGAGQLQLTAPEVPFDLAGTGKKRLFSWTGKDADDAFLYLDRDLNGAVTDGRELFGDATPLSWDMRGARATNGFEALRWFDQPMNGGNGDGWITSEDRVFAYLWLWFDYNHDGVSQPMETWALSSRGITRFAVVPSTSHRQDRHGNLFLFRTWYNWSDDAGRRKAGWVYDVFLVSRDY